MASILWDSVGISTFGFSSAALFIILHNGNGRNSCLQDDILYHHGSTVAVTPA
ncbi:hypothetical protein [Paenibacillus sp. OAS669]|uniref:hypothetical protein n=1 Tax=Paenibacillus sp. OAS669 TaxID=2663821 RepID=UPI001789F94F|nr:hypothetical protein [Paenibacillus sp. OAS669]MBE1442687.1 hypothetical protein [Paenibacillus sp. OAS669]